MARAVTHEPWRARLSSAWREMIVCASPARCSLKSAIARRTSSRACRRRPSILSCSARAMDRSRAKREPKKDRSVRLTSIERAGPSLKTSPLLYPRRADVPPIGRRFGLAAAPAGASGRRHLAALPEFDALQVADGIIARGGDARGRIDPGGAPPEVPEV